MTGLAGCADARALTHDLADQPIPLVGADSVMFEVELQQRAGGHAGLLVAGAIDIAGPFGVWRIADQDELVGVHGHGFRGGVDTAGAALGRRLSWRMAQNGERHPVAQPMADTPRNFRLKGLVVCDALLRLARIVSDIYGPDLERFVVYLAVISAGVSGFKRDPELRSLYSDQDPLPDQYRLAISRRAIADSVGLPRETVRRKIAQLIADGLLVEEGSLVRARSPVVEQGRNLEFLLGALREFERATTELRRAEEG